MYVCIYIIAVNLHHYLDEYIHPDHPITHSSSIPIFCLVLFLPTSDCKYNNMHATLMCSEYIKAGWVTYDYLEKQNGQKACDSKASLTRPGVWALWFAVVMCLFTVLSQR